MSSLFYKPTVTDIDGIRVLGAPAEFDVYTAPKVREAAVEAVNSGFYRQVVDLSATTYIDSTGLGVLVGALKRTGVYGGWLRLACLPEPVQSTFRKTGLFKVFDVYDTVEAAIDHETEGTTPP
jgi:anti-sigma B factor antagonist